MSDRAGMSLLARASAAAGSLRCLAAATTDIVEDARRRHGLYPTAAAAVGRTMTATVMMGAMLTDDQRVVVEIVGDGPLGHIVADADAHGNVRAYAANPRVHLPANAKGKLDVAGAVGKGTLHVTKDLQLREMYRGMVPLISGEIAEDFAYYFVQSEQVPSAVSLGVLVDTDSSIRAAGGLIVQVLPGADPALIDELEKRLKTLQSVSHMVQIGMGPAQMIDALLDGFDVRHLGEMPLQFSCRCSRERFSKALIALGPAEIEAMIREPGGAELVCNFCAETYHFTADDLRQLIQAATDDGDDD